MVRLVSLTRPHLEELSEFTPEELIVYIARVSNPSNQLNKATAPKLLKYCFEHGHWSVFEHVFATLEIKTTRAIAAQILRHRSFFAQEFSQRYAVAQEIDTNIEARLQDAKNRQNSIPTDDAELKEWFSLAQKQLAEFSSRLYNEALQKGIAKEQARFLLPLSTKTTIYLTGNIRSWIHYVMLRSKNGTQKEHSEIASAAKNELKKHFPVIFSIVEEKMAEASS
jgi:thymidylate synthase (FAD)